MPQAGGKFPALESERAIPAIASSILYRGKNSASILDFADRPAFLSEASEGFRDEHQANGKSNRGYRGAKRLRQILRSSLLCRGPLQAARGVQESCERTA